MDIQCISLPDNPVMMYLMWCVLNCTSAKTWYFGRIFKKDRLNQSFAETFINQIVAWPEITFSIHKRCWSFCLLILDMLPYYIPKIKRWQYSCVLVKILMWNQGDVQKSICFMDMLVWIQSHSCYWILILTVIQWYLFSPLLTHKKNV